MLIFLLETYTLPNSQHCNAKENKFSAETLKELDAQSSFQYLKDTAQLEHKHKPYCFSARPQLNPA